MDPKEIKSHLKAAREAIAKKEYKEAIKHCKGILKADKSHYNALVFVGVAAEGLEQAEQARMAYERAIEADATQPLAWQGLCGFYEKTGVNHRELVPVYEKLLELRKGDEKKSAETKAKLVATLQFLGELDRALCLIKEMINETDEDKITIETWKKLIELSNECAQEDPDSELLSRAYDRCLSSEEVSEEEKCRLNEQVIRRLCERGGTTQDIIKACVDMKQVHSTSIYPRQVLCQVLLYTTAGTGSTAIDCVAARKELENLAPENAVVLFLKALDCLREKTFSEAKDHIMKGLKSETSFLPGWWLLAEAHIALRDPSAAAKCLQKAEGLLNKQNYCLFGFDKNMIEAHLEILSAQAVSLNRNTVSTQQAIELCKKVLQHDEENIRALEMITDLYIDLQEWQQALAFAERVKAVDGEKYLLLGGVISLEMGDLEKAEERLKAVLARDGGHAMALYHLGRLYWQRRHTARQMASQCYEHLLKAARADPYNAKCFLYLGHYQTQVVKDVQKGAKCYQKSYTLDPQCEEAGIALVDAYNALQQEDSALGILRSVTSRASAGTCKWAWLRLGLHQLKHEDPSLAIVSLQAALRADKDDYHCYECLGEAYLQRGSYTASLKAFTRATELQPQNTYSFYQIGSIKLALGSYAEAIHDYTTILNSTPDYVPALKGIGECYLHLEKAAVRDFFHGRAVTYCETAARFLTSAAQKKPEFSCLWKLLGDCCCVLNVIPPEVCRVQLPALLLAPGHAPDDVMTLEKADVLALGARCYGMALKCQPECAALWHDVGVAYMYQARTADKTAAKLLMAKAFQGLERALQLDPENHAYWNTLGLAALSKEVNNKALAQHCFIRSVQCEASNVVAWTNLGVLYLQADDVTLAHQAFKVAQSLEPSYVASWIGQALIAETIGQSEEAMDLFRHTTELAHHTEGAVGYAQFVCSLLKDKVKRSTDWNKYVIEKMWAVPAATDVMAKYTDRIRTDATGYNLYGLLLERQRLYRDAARSFTAATQLLKADPSKAALYRQASLNLARVLVHKEEFEKAVQIYGDFKPETLEEQCSYALALYKMGLYEDSIQQYEAALALVTSAEDTSHIYAAMGMVRYRAGVKATGSADVDGAKAVLFQCTQATPASVHGLNALLSLGVIQADVTLADAVVTELQTFTEQRESDGYAYMLASVQALKGARGAGKRELARLIHARPDRAAAWAYLVQYLLSHEPEVTDTVARCCQVALHHDTRNSVKNLRTWLAVALLGAGKHSRSVTHRNSYRAAQRAVFLNPDNLESWVALIGSMYGELITLRCLQREENLAQPLLTLITHFMAKVEGQLSEKRGNTSRLQALHLWCVKQYVVALLAADRREQAQEFLNQALWLYDEDLHLQNLLAYINQNFSVLKVNAINDSRGFTRLILVQLYMAHGLVEEAETILKMWLPQARTKPRKILALVRLAFFAFKQIIAGCNRKEEMEKLFAEACAEVLKIDPRSVVVHYMMGALAVCQRKEKRKQKSLTECLEHYSDVQNFTYAKQTAEALLGDLLEKNKEQTIQPGATAKQDVRVQKDPFDE